MSPGKPLRVLLVEDRDVDAELIEREVRRDHPDALVRRVQSEADLRHALASFVPHLVISDHSLPAFAGSDALRIVREHDPDLPFIVATGSIDEETAVDYIQAGATDYVVKNRLHRLLPSLARAMALSEAQHLALQANTALRESEERFRQMAEYIKEAFFLLDSRTGQPLYVSPTWAEIWGRPLAEGYDARIWFAAVHPDDQSILREGMELVTEGFPSTTTFRVLRPDGETRWVRGRAFPVRDDAGRIYRTVGVAEDITELRRTEERFVQAQKMEAIGRLAGGVAHDFNNLLTVILAETEQLLADAPGDSSRQPLQEVMKAGHRAAVLTRQLLAFSRRQVVQPVAFDLNATVKEVTGMLRRLIGEDVALVVELSSHGTTVFADQGQVEQVITNLAVNARDAMPKGGTLRIETGGIVLDDAALADRPDVMPGEFVTLLVSDTGSGMTDDVKAKIFEPFFTTKDHGKGTGLGLATCYGIVRGTGGFMTVESAVGTGTGMMVYLPRTAAEPSAETDEADPITGGSETILLVEDEPGVRRVASRMLQREGYSVLEAGSGEEAEEILRSWDDEIHLLLTDVVLPGIGGRELADGARRVRPALKVIFASGYTDDVILQHRLLEQGTVLIEKPFTREKLVRRVREVLDAR